MISRDRFSRTLGKGWRAAKIKKVRFQLQNFRQIMRNLIHQTINSIIS